MCITGIDLQITHIFDMKNLCTSVELFRDIVSMTSVLLTYCFVIVSVNDALSHKKISLSLTYNMFSVC